MPNQYLAAFVDRLSQMDDESLLRTLVRIGASPGQYEPDAIAAVQREAARQGLRPAQGAEVIRRVRQDALGLLNDHATDLARQGRSDAHIQAQLETLAEPDRDGTTRPVDTRDESTDGASLRSVAFDTTGFRVEVSTSQDKFAEAGWALTRAHSMFRSTLGDPDIRTVRALSNRARVCQSLGRLAEADALFGQALPALEAHRAIRDRASAAAARARAARVIAEIKAMTEKRLP